MTANLQGSVEWAGPIPAKMHYIWFGGEARPASMERTIDGWRRLMPGFEVVEWDESNFDVGQHPWLKRMYDERRYAFASDYARLRILLDHGGVYLDTDVVMKKSIAPFFRERCFWSFEYDSFLSTCIIGSVPGHPLIADMIRMYDTLEDPVVNNTLVTQYFLDHFPEMHLNNREQVVAGDVRIFPKENFVIPSWDSRRNFSVHKANNHWKEGKRKSSTVGRLVRGVVGEVLFYKLLNIHMNSRSDFQAKDRARARK